MGHTLETRAALAALELPEDDALRRRIQSFLLRSGLSQSEFGDAINYSATAVNHFLHGRYGANHLTANNSRAFKAAAKAYVDAHELNETIALNRPHHRTGDFAQVRLAALNALRRSVAYIVDGPPGTQKTESLRRVEAEINQDRLGRAVYVYARVNHSPQAFLMECCSAAGVPNRGNIDALLRKLRFFLADGRTLLMVDEAQHLNHAGLEVLRQLLDLPPHFGVMLAGSHDLTQRLSHWEMEQWRSRSRKTILMTGPTRAEAARILRAELGDLSQAECDETIAACMVKTQRTERVKGKLTAVSHTYLSARDLFGAIERVQDQLNAPSTNEQTENAA